MKYIILLLILTSTMSYGQDYKKKYWAYTDSMWIKRAQRDTLGERRYQDSMVKYHRFNVVTGKQLK